MEYILVVVWLRRRTPGAKRLALIGLAVAVGLALLQRYVVTDQEQLRAVCAGMVAETESGDVAALARYVDREFSVGEIDRDGFVAAVEQTLTRFAVENAALSVRTIEVDGDRATVVFRVSCRIVGDETMGWGDVPSLWRVVFIRRADGWLLIEVNPQSTPVFPFDRLEQLIR